MVVYAAEAMTNAERYAAMGTTTALGVGTVFAVLIFLCFFMVAMRFIFARPSKKKTSRTVEAVVTVQPKDDNELIAVLSAAVAAMMNTSTTKFRIKSFRRTK